MGIIVAVEPALRARWVGSPLMSFTRLLGLGLLLWSTETESASDHPEPWFALLSAAASLREGRRRSGRRRLAGRDKDPRVRVVIADDQRSNTEIASVLYVGVSTIKTHVNRVFAKTRSRSRTHAAAYARSHGLAP